MKTCNLTSCLFFIAINFLLISTTRSQDKDNPWMIGFGVNAIDHYSTNIKGMTSNVGNPTKWYDQFFNLNDHYNYISAPSKLSLSRYMNKSFNAELAFTINQITQFGTTTLTKSVPYFAIDVNAHYNINMLIGDTGFFDPYALLGGGFTMQSGDGDNNVVFKNQSSFNSGLGAQFWIYKGLGLRVQSMLKYFFNDGSYRHFQHSASIIYKFGAYDGDNDGIDDCKDKCPEVYGLKEFNGCPDSDNDGVPDAVDECPDVFGVVALNGCLDTDGDGILDKDDLCTTIKGKPEFKGCPDTDGDGVIDVRDACPTVPGLASRNGCPDIDSDGDGVPDNKDKCKFEPGLKSNNGCPIVKEQLASTLTELASSILFKNASDVIYPKYKVKLDEMAELMKQNSQLKYRIDGHTDNVGSTDANYRLSVKRVHTVLNYLISKGVNQINLSVKGFGELYPIATNATPEGRALNRRVEIKITN